MQEAPPAPPLPGQDPDSVTMLAPPAPPLPTPSQAPPAPPLPSRIGYSVEGKPYYGPRRPTTTRCLNAYPLLHYTDYRVQCPEGAANFLACRSMHCLSCGWNRGHQVTGYGRSRHCKCFYCQHNPAFSLPQDEELELTVTGTVAPLMQFQVLMGDGTYFVVNPNRVD